MHQELCASWLFNSSLQLHANDSYANEHHSKLLAAEATVISPIHRDLLAFPTLCPPFQPFVLPFYLLLGGGLLIKHAAEGQLGYLLVRHPLY